MKYDLGKMKNSMPDVKAIESKARPSMNVSPELLKVFGVKDELVSQAQTMTKAEELFNLQQLITGAANLMHQRVTDAVSPGISMDQYENWMSDVQRFSNQYKDGKRTYSQIYKFIEKSIDMEDERPKKEETTEE